MTNKITYTQQGDYLLPDLKLPEQPKVEIGIFSKRHLRYLEHNRKILYINLLTKGKLTAHLAEIDKLAEDMFFRLVKEIAEREGGDQSAQSRQSNAVGRGSPVETSAAGRSADRADRRDSE